MMIQWGVLGYGNIAKRFIKGLSYSENGQLYGVASLTPQKRQQCLCDHPHLHIYEKYEDMIQDENIDAIYIAVPHASHYQWAKEALLHNKAVLCEKPAALTYKQTKELCDLSKKKHTVFMEAMKTRFIPMVTEIKSLLEKGVLGEIQCIQTSFCSDVPYDKESYLFDQVQGGALYDVGIYNIATILDYIHEAVVDIKGHIEYRYGVDSYDYIELEFESGKKAIIEVAIDRKKPKAMIITGTLGTLKAEPFYRPTEVIVELNNGESFTGKKEYQYDDFYGEIEEIHRCIAYIQNESLRMSHQDSLDCITLIEKIRGVLYD